MGRPKGSLNKKKRMERRIQFQLKKQEKDLIRAMAAEAGMTVSSWIRMLIDREMVKDGE